MNHDRTEPTIRPATAADQEAWLPLWLGYQRFYQVSIDESTTASARQRILDPDQPMHCALAVIDDDGTSRVAGFVHYLTHASFWTQGPYCYLQDLFVSPDIRARVADVRRAMQGGQPQ